MEIHPLQTRLDQLTAERERLLNQLAFVDRQIYSVATALGRCAMGETDPDIFTERRLVLIKGGKATDS